MWESRINQKFVRSFLDVITLATLYLAPAHGYEIMGFVHNEFGVLLSPGTLYPLLHSLEDGGLIESGQDSGRIVYRISPKGKKKLKSALSTFSLAVEKMSNFMKELNRETVLTA